MKRFRRGLVFKAHRLVYHSTLDLRVIKQKKKKEEEHLGEASGVTILLTFQGVPSSLDSGW